MGSTASGEFAAWLREGGMVVTASDRSARALRSTYDRARLTEGLTAWPAPRIVDWRTFVREAWDLHTVDGRLLLNSTQEQSIWAQIAERSRQPATVLDGPRHRIAALAMDAHELLATHAPRYLRSIARSSWPQDAATFSSWLDEFDAICRESNLLSECRMPLELAPKLEPSASQPRPPLLIAGFDRIHPAQRAVFDAWGHWREAPHGEIAASIHYFQVGDTQTESAACALWCNQQLARNLHVRLLVITQDTRTCRGELERAFLRHLDPGNAPPFEFSLGVPLSTVPLARGAFLLLRWFSGPIEETELDWLFSTAQFAANPDESAALQRLMRELRRRDRQRTHWTLEALFREPLAVKFMPPAWQQRISAAQNRLASAAQRQQNPPEWAALIPELLKTSGWPGFRPLSSLEFQAMHRWQQAIETCGSLGFNGRRMRWRDFLSTLSRTSEETLFAPESSNAPILVAGPAETAGLTADAIWFLGADDSSWPPNGSTHPFLPIAVQREAAMPHATAQVDWELAHRVTSRLLSAAPEIVFSYAKQQKTTETRASRIVLELARKAQALSDEFVPRTTSSPIAVPFVDASRVPFPHASVTGGAAILTLQSQCPFKAFAVARLDARGWEPAQAGLSSKLRGQLLHSVMHSVWSGKPLGVRSLEDLQSIADTPAFVARHVERVLDRGIPEGIRNQMPRRYLELETPRLTRLISEWLEYERARQAFEVAETEAASEAAIAGLAFKLRLDRLDRLNDGSLLVIDYKTGDISPSSWDLPRPDDVQLPLYAGFALHRDSQPLGGVAFARIRPGKYDLAGRAFAPAATLFAGLKGASLAKKTLTLDELSDWRTYIETLANDFIGGCAAVNPKSYPATCEHCELHALCRVDENRALLNDEDDANSEDAFEDALNE